MKQQHLVASQTLEEMHVYGWAWLGAGVTWARRLSKFRWRKRMQKEGVGDKKRCQRTAKGNDLEELPTRKVY